MKIRTTSAMTISTMVPMATPSTTGCIVSGLTKFGISPSGGTMAGMSSSVQPAAMFTVAIEFSWMDGICTRSVVVMEFVPGI